MATPKQVRAARKNIRKAQAAWAGMTPRARAIAQPQGRLRKKPGATGLGNFYRIEIRSKSEFTSFRTQDVGRHGGLERVAGRRSSGSWATVAWLISKADARVTENHHLIIEDPKARSMLKNIRGPIVWVKGDVFSAHPRKNIAEKAKPTPAQRRAQKVNIKKAQQVRKKR